MEEQGKKAEMEDEATTQDEEQDRVWAGDLFGVTRQVKAEEPDTFLVEVPPIYSEVVPDVREWRDEVMDERAPNRNAQMLVEIDVKLEEVRAVNGQHVNAIRDANLEIERLENARREIENSGIEADWIAPVRAILKPHEEEFNKSVDFVDAKVMSVGLNSEGRMTYSLQAVDGEVPDQTGLEMDDPLDVRREVWSSLEVIRLTREFLQKREATLADRIMELDGES